MRPRETALSDRLARLVEVCKEEGVTLLANGDVKNRTEALELMSKTGVDGVMIARGAEYNPSCFRTEQEGGLLPPLDIGRELVEVAYEVDNPLPNTKYILLRILADVSKTREYQGCQKAKTYGDLFHALSMKPPEVKSIGTNLHLRHGATINKSAMAA